MEVWIWNATVYRTSFEFKHNFHLYVDILSSEKNCSKKVNIFAFQMVYTEKEIEITPPSQNRNTGLCLKYNLNTYVVKKKYIPVLLYNKYLILCYVCI